MIMRMITSKTDLWELDVKWRKYKSNIITREGYFHRYCVLILMLTLTC